MGTTKWMLNKVKHINRDRMNKHIDIIAKNSGKSKFYIKIDLFINVLLRGCGYTDYFRGNYINLTSKEKDTFVTAKSFYKIIHYLNDDKYKIILNDKIIFNKLFKDYLKRDFISLREARLEEFEKFLKNKEIIFAKNPNGEGGYGIKKIIVNEYKTKELYEMLIKENLVLVEQAIIQCKELNELNPYAVNSFRIITLYKDGKVHILNNALRVNQDDSGHIGSTNDLYFSFDETGKIDSNVVDDYANVYEKHPLTKKKFSEVRVKEVKEAFKIAREMALKIPQVRYIGWDIAFGENGPVVVEANEYPGYGLVQFYKLKNSKTGHLKEIADILGEEMDKIKL